MRRYKGGVIYSGIMLIPKLIKIHQLVQNLLGGKENMFYYEPFIIISYKHFIKQNSVTSTTQVSITY